VRDISLHILDLIENSIRADASVVSLTVVENPDDDVLKICVEDDGRGLSVEPEQATDPFYTTKSGKRTGLGLSLLKEAAERAGGMLTLSRSPLGGLSVEATMHLSHIDRTPLGDLAATLASVVCTNPRLDLRCRFCVGDRECTVRVLDIADELPAGERCGFVIAQRVSESVKSGLAAVEVMA